MSNYNTVDPTEIDAFVNLLQGLGVDPVEMRQLVQNAGPGMTHLPTIEFTDGTLLPGQKL
jgi:hypothetical protein